MPFQTGDILKTDSFTIPFSRHYAIYFMKDGVGYVAHNPLKPAITIEPVNDFLKGRKFFGVVAHADLTDQQIYHKATMLKNRRTWSLFYNCEDFIREICNCWLGIDQRLIFVGFVVIMIVLLRKVFK